MHKPHNDAVYRRDKNVTNFVTSGTKCDKIFVNRENPWYYWVSKGSEKRLILSHVTKNETNFVTSGSNLSFYTFFA